MRPPRTVDELMALLGRRQNIPIKLPPPVPAPVLLIQPGVTTRSIPGFGVSPTPPPRAPAPAPQQPSRAPSQPNRPAISSAAPSAAPSAPTNVAGGGRGGGRGGGAVNSSISSSISAPRQTSAPTSASRGRARPSAPPAPSSIPTSIPTAGNLAPQPTGLPSMSPTGSLASDMMQPTESGVVPNRGAANADSPEARGKQIGTVIGILVAVGLISGVLAMFCVRQANRKKAKAAERAPTPDFISRPLARKDSDPWQGPIRSGSSGAGGVSGGNVAAAGAGAAAARQDDEWPMGAGNANQRFDEKEQYAAFRPPPPVAVVPGSTTRAQNGQAGYAGGAGMVGSNGGGNEQYTQYPIASTPTTTTPEDRESLSKYATIAKINQHYAAAERLSRQPGNFAPVNPPSPLYFRPAPNSARPDSSTFGGPGGGGGQYGGAPQQGRY